MEAPISPEESHSFAATLPYSERRLASRLEAFGDIVFGFAVSQCALQLPVKAGHVDILRPFGLLLYVLTFALIASLWLIYHRLMSGAFAPRPLDLLLAFAYLALVSLMPFALYAVSHTTETVSGARAAVAEYTSLYAAMTAIAAFVSLRNLRRGYRIVGEDENDRTWRTAVRTAVVASVMLAALVVDRSAGPTATFVVFPIIPILIITVRRLAPRAPSERVLRLAPLEQNPA